MTTIQPTMPPAEAIARELRPAWAPGALVWATWLSGPGPVEMEWQPGRVLGRTRDGQAWRVEVSVYGGTETVDRDAVELLLREVDQERRAVLRRGQGLTPGSSTYEITCLHDGVVASRSLARGDEIESWRADLRREGYTLDEA